MQKENLGYLIGRVSNILSVCTEAICQANIDMPYDNWECEHGSKAESVYFGVADMLREARDMAAEAAKMV